MKNPQRRCEQLLFRPFRYDMESDALWRGDEEVALQPRVLALLRYLIAKRGRICSKRELLDSLWADATVGDSSLTDAVKLLRQALGDDPRSPRYIQTVHRRGYRFIAESEEIPAASDRDSAARMSPRSMALAGAALGCLLTAGVIFAVAEVRRSPSPAVSPLVFEIDVPSGTLLEAYQMYPYPALSPDGTKLVLAPPTSAGVPLLWIRDNRSGQMHQVPGSEGAEDPFWSPHGDRVVFRVEGDLFVFDVARDSVDWLGSVPWPGGTWSEESGILVTSAVGLELWPQDGGSRRLVSSLDKARGELSHRFPHFLPDGVTFLYVTTATDPELSGLWITSTVSNRKKLLFEGPEVYNAVYVEPGWLLRPDNAVLSAQAFDAESWEFTGEPIPLTGPVPIGYTRRYSPFSATPDTLVYREDARVNTELAWYDRSGREVEKPPPIGAPGRHMSPALSPSADRLAVAYFEIYLNHIDVWVLHRPQGVWQQLTRAPNWDNVPRWSADGSALWVTSARDGGPRPWRFDLFDSAEPTAGRQRGWLIDVLPTGELIQRWSNRLWLVSDTGEDPRPITPADLPVIHGRASADGRWIAYHGGGPDQSPVFVKPLRGNTAPVRISPGSGREPRWRRDGSEIYYLEPRLETAVEGSIESILMSVPVEIVDGELRFGAATPLFMFRHPLEGLNVSWNYDVSADGERFLVNVVVDETPGRLRAFLNWQEGLPQR